MSSSIAEVLTIARARGFLGPGDVMFHVEHARAFVPLVRAGQRVLDLGSGGGLPGLVLAAEVDDLRITLLDASRKRTAFLEEAVELLGLPSVDVMCERAENAGRDPAVRGAYDVVVSRSFAKPAVTAECAAPMLVVGGRLVVSDLEGGAERWDPTGLGELGMALGDRRDAPPAVLQVLTQVSPCPDRYPRRTGVPTKRPLF